MTFFFISFGTWVLLGTCLTISTHAQSRPPNFSPDAIPDTSFTCEDKITGGYYADIEAECQLFHVCVQVSEFEFQDFRFLCPNDTVFDQQNLVCTNWFEVDCRAAVHFFIQEIGLKDSAKIGPKKNKNIFSHNDYDYYDDEELDYGPESKDDENLNLGNRFLANSSPALNTGSRGVGGGHPGQGFPNDTDNEDYDLNDRLPIPPKPSKSTTAIPIGVTTTTTRRPPRVKSNIRLNGGTRNNNRHRVAPATNDKLLPFNATKITDDRFNDPFINPPAASADGKKPRVKSNVKANKAFFKTNIGHNSLREGSRVNDVDTSSINFVDPSEQSDSLPSPFSGPEVRPDGRPARVKANVEAARQIKDRPISQRKPLLPQPPLEFAPPLVPQLQPPQSLQDDDESSTTVGPEEEIDNDVFSRPLLPVFSPSSTQGPRVKSNILANQRNNGQLQSGKRDPAVQEAPRTSHIDPDSSQFEQLPSPPAPESFKPVFVDEIDEYEEYDDDPPLSTSTTSPPSDTSHKPRVKSNLLANQNSRSKPLKRPINLSPEIDSEEADEFFTSDDSECINPFKCPPSKVADGRKPRVKSNIKAISRNYHFPDHSSNRIKGRAKPDRNNFNQFLTNLKTRSGKISRENGLSKIHNNDFNGIHVTFQDEKDTTTQSSFVQLVSEVSTTTENLLFVLLNQIEQERDRNDADEDGDRPQPAVPTSLPIRHPTFASLPPPPQPSFNQIKTAPRPKPTPTNAPTIETEQLFTSPVEWTEAPATTDDPSQSKEQIRQDILKSTYERLQNFLANKQRERESAKQSNVDANQHSFPSFPTATTLLAADSPRTRFPPFLRPTPASIAPAEDPMATTESVLTVATTANPPSTLGVAVDGRVPRVKSNIRLASINSRRSGLRSKFSFATKSQKEIAVSTEDPEESVLNDLLNEAVTQPDRIVIADSANEPIEEETATEPAKTTRFGVLKPDGRQPRVKANLKAQLALLGRSPVKRKVQVKPSDSINFFDDNKDGGLLGFGRNESERVINEDDDQPVVRPDGQKPRVKSNLPANKINKFEVKGFRHSTKVSNHSNRAKFRYQLKGRHFKSDVEEETTLVPFEPTPVKITNNDSNEPTTPTTQRSPTIVTEATTTYPTVTVLSTTPSLADTSILDFIFSTQVLNTRAVDPTLASLQQTAIEQTIQNNSSDKPDEVEEESSTTLAVL